MRLYDVPLQVRTVPDVPGRHPSGEPSPPDQFLWRERLFVVREVLGRWRERTAWWAGSVGRGVHGDGVEPGSHEPGSHEPGSADGTGALRSRWDAADRWVWRVEASSGGSGVAGTYDISCEGPAGAEGSATWRMVRVSD